MLKRLITPKTVNAAMTVGTGIIGLGLLAAGYANESKAAQKSPGSIKNQEPKPSTLGMKP